MKSRITQVMFGTAVLLFAQLSMAETGDKSAEDPSSNSQTKAPEVTQNNRMKVLLGSKSLWSGQLNFTYLGSSISHPFNALAPNPGNQVPPPLVTLSGIVSARYRLDDKTTLGLGTGLTTQTPLQGPKNSTIADPNVDIAHFFSLGPFQDRLDFLLTLWTNSQYNRDYGYRFGVTALNELFYVTNFGLTAGLAIQMDYNLFDTSKQYDTSQQIQYDFFFSPYFEYQLSSKVNLRSVINFGALHNVNLGGKFAFYTPSISQTFGVGIIASNSLFVYPFIQFFPFSGNVTTNTILVGANTIINLF